MLEDKLLLFRLKCGSSDALKRVYEKYRVFLLKIAIAMLGDVQASEDIVHDVFLRFVQNSRHISIRGSLKAFLRTCVVNAVHDRLRKLKVRGIAVELQDSPSQDAETGKWVIINEQFSEVVKALGKLPPEQNEVIIFHHLGEMTFRQIAIQTGQSISTVQSRHRYGLDKLREILKVRKDNE